MELGVDRTLTGVLPNIGVSVGFRVLKTALCFTDLIRRVLYPLCLSHTGSRQRFRKCIIMHVSTVTLNPSGSFRGVEQPSQRLDREKVGSLLINLQIV